MKAIEQVCREQAEQAVALLLDMIRNEDTPPAQRLAAAREILDRGFGKPVDRSVLLNLDGSGSSSDPDALSDAALLRIAAGGGAQLIDLKPISRRTESEDTPPADLKRDE